jgi:hypothetical protein
MFPMYKVGTMLTLSAQSVDGSGFRYWTCGDPSGDAGVPQLLPVTITVDVTQPVRCLATFGQ